MNRRGLIALFALVLLPLAAFAVEIKLPEAALADVRRIYVDQLGGCKTSDQFRDMLIAPIQSSGLFVITENAERADATLKGSGDALIFTEEHNSNDSIGIHANAGSGSSSRALNSGVSSNQTMGLGVTNDESVRMQERRHEATGSIRLVGKDGDVIWTTTEESGGGKFRSAMADVADKIVRKLADETRRVRELAALSRAAQPAGSDKAAAPISDAKPTPASSSAPKADDTEGRPKLARRAPADSPEDHPAGANQRN